MFLPAPIISRFPRFLPPGDAAVEPSFLFFAFEPVFNFLLDEFDGSGTGFGIQFVALVMPIFVGIFVATGTGTGFVPAGTKGANGVIGDGGGMLTGWG